MSAFKCSILFGTEDMAKEFDRALFEFLNGNQADVDIAASRIKVKKFDEPRTRLVTIEADCSVLIQEIKCRAGLPNH